MPIITKHILVLNLLLYPVIAFGQDFVYPTIQSSGNDILDFIPKNWALIDLAKGFSEEKSAAFYALVIENTDTATIKKIAPEEELENIDIPKILILLFKTTNGYQLSIQNSALLMENSLGPAENFEEITINDKGILSIQFFGGMSTKRFIDYKYRFQRGQWVLIGEERFKSNFYTKYEERQSYNYLTKKMHYLEISLQEDGSEQKIEEWQDLDMKELETLNNFESF